MSVGTAVKQQKSREAPTQSWSRDISKRKGPLSWMSISSIEWVSESRSVVSDFFRLRGLYSPWSSPGQNTGVGSHSLFLGIFPTQGLNPRLLYCRWILYQLIHKGRSVTVQSSLYLTLYMFILKHHLSWPEDLKRHDYNLTDIPERFKKIK